MAIGIPFDSARVSAMEKIKPGKFFYWLQQGTSNSDLCVGIETPKNDETRRAFVRLTGQDRFRVQTTGHLSELSVILLPDLVLSFKIETQKAQGDPMLKVGTLNFTASGPVLSVLPVAGDSLMYLDLHRWNAFFDAPDFHGRFTDWQLVHTTANGIEQPMISMGAFDLEGSAPVVGSI